MPADGTKPEQSVPAGFEIAGEVYEVPRLDSFDMDEAQILYDLSGIVMEDFIPPHPDATDEEKEAIHRVQLLRVRNPAFRRALVHVAYRRKHPDYDFAELDKAVGKLNAADVSIATLSRGDEPDPSMSSPSEPEEKSSTNGTSEPSSSGKPSGSDSAGRVVSLARIGTGRSDTSSQESSPAPLAS